MKIVLVFASVEFFLLPFRLFSTIKQSLSTSNIVFELQQVSTHLEKYQKNKNKSTSLIFRFRVRKIIYFFIGLSRFNYDYFVFV